jgi:hypothetical protein
VVGGVTHPEDQSGDHGPIDQAHGAVVAKQEMVGHLAHRRILPAGVAPDGQEELVLGGGEAHGGGLFLAPSKEPTEAGSKLQETAVLGVREPCIVAHRGEIS